ncbi:DUF2180 family protein [Streptomyces sp. S1D4-11]|nr:DUF2180 family protein [Streptomyces sp. S1D4-11]
MYCYECQALGRETPGIAVCHPYGTALCAEHAHAAPRPIAVQDAVSLTTRPHQARWILCPVCHAAETCVR